MRTSLNQLRRAPGRVAATILALALAAAAVGILAIPALSSDTLHSAAEADQLPDVTLHVTDASSALATQLEADPGIVAADGELDIGVVLDDDRSARLVGLDFADQRMDLLTLDTGRLPAATNEVVTDPTVAPLGEHIDVLGEKLIVVGHGGTLWWSDQLAIYGQFDDVGSLAGIDGPNRIVMTAVDDGLASLRRAVDTARPTLAADGASLADFPILLPDGSTPIDDDLAMISTMIGMLGVVAGLVALVLLGSTTTTLIVEQHHDIAVMRALGSRARPLRRRLRQTSMLMTVIGLAIGLPLGVIVANVIARLLLQRFVGVTPGFGVSWPVIIATTAVALLGSRLVSARAARRITTIPLADALRGQTTRLGGSRLDRLVARVATGNPWVSHVLRSIMHRRSRSAAVLAQVAAGVGAAVVVMTLATSIANFNTATRAPWSWNAQAASADPGLTIEIAGAEDLGNEIGDVEAAILVTGQVDEWDVEVFGLEPSTAMFEPTLDHGRWIRSMEREVAVSRGLAVQAGLVIGDDLDLGLATGRARYRVVGVVDDHGSAVYAERGNLSEDLGRPGHANVLWSSSGHDDLPAVRGMSWTTASDLAAGDAEARTAVLVIFAAIGAVLSTVSALAVSSMLLVNLHDDRSQLAMLRAIGAGRHQLFRLVLAELLPLTLVGTFLGFVGGHAAAKAIIGVFERSDAIDIGTVFSAWSIPLVAVPTFGAVLLLARLAVRTIARRPVASVLRGT